MKEPDLLPKKNQKILIKIEEMSDVFLNLTNFVQHVILTLAPPSGYTLNLKALIEVSKVSSFERKFRKDKLHFFEKTPL